MVLLEVEEIAAGDFCPDYGTVIEAVTEGDSVRIEFKNGTTIYQPKGALINTDQGGRFNHGTGENSG